MDSLPGIRVFISTTASACTNSLFPSNRYCLLFPRDFSFDFPLRRRASRRLPMRTPAMVSVLKPPRSVAEVAGDDVLQTFLKERGLNGDFVSKVSDMLWMREVTNFEADATMLAETTSLSQEPLCDEDEGGFLKLTKTHDWLSGDNSAPVNKKLTTKELGNDGERRKRLNLLNYDALKRELMLLTLVPAMFGMFAYKAAALVQVYRDNEDLKLIFSENEEESSI